MYSGSCINMVRYTLVILLYNLLTIPCKSKSAVNVFSITASSLQIVVGHIVFLRRAIANTEPLRQINVQLIDTERRF
jgi:hypothetical protein